MMLVLVLVLVSLGGGNNYCSVVVMSTEGLRDPDLAHVFVVGM